MNKLRMTIALLLMLSACCAVHAQSSQAPTFTGATAAAYVVGTNYPLTGNSAVTVAAVGIPTPTLTESGALPAGISFQQSINPEPNDVGAYELVGTPAAGSAGTYNLTITASNGISPDATLAFTLTVVNATVSITNGFTGNWFDASQSGHGFSIEVLPGNVMFAEWYVFAPSGGQSWIVATGPIAGDTAVLQGFQPVGPGGVFPPKYDPTQVQNELWGSITFVFTDCNNGFVSWQPTAQGYTGGSLPISRLTMPAGLSCP
jgi:hypothetical protein